MRNILQGVPYLMNNTALILCFRKGGCNGFFDSGQTISTEDQDIFYTVVFQLIRMDSQYLELSLSVRTSFFSSVLIPKITYAANLRITPLSRIE